MADMPNTIDTPSEPEQEVLVTGMNQLNVVGDNTETCQYDSTKPPRTTGRKPGDKPGDVGTSHELTPTSGTFDETVVTGSGDIPESYEIIHSITYEASEMDSSWSIIDQDNENIRDITSTTSELPVTGGEESAVTEFKTEVMTNTTDGRPLAAVQPSVFSESESHVTSEPSQHFTQQLLSPGDSTPGPGQEAGARSQDVQSESGGVTSSTPPSTKKEVDLLLIGKTGHGKSSTGNSILKRRQFETSNMGNSATYDVCAAWTDIDDYIVKVIDGPGVAETRLEGAEAVKKACNDMAKAMFICPKGFHALLLVLKFGERFTKEEEDCIAILKSILGQNIVRDYCVIVVTHGELFDMEDDCKDFQDWCTKQVDGLKQLFIECKYRCVLMRNKTKSEEVKETQLRQLMATLHTMRYREIRYTNELFIGAQPERDRIVVEAKAPQLKEEILKNTSLLLGDLTKLRDNNDDLDEIDTILLRMEERADELVKRINTEDNQTGVLSDLKKNVNSLQESIKIEKAINKQRKEDRKIQDQLIKEHEENIAKLKVQHAEEQNKLEEQLRTASDAEKRELSEKLLADSNANYDKKIDELESIFNQRMDKAKKEETQKWETVLDETRKGHTQQMEAFESRCKSLQAKVDEKMITIQAISDQLEELQKKKEMDPTKITVKCMDQEGRIVAVTIQRTSTIAPLIQSYYGLSGYPPEKIKFEYNGQKVTQKQTPIELKMGDDDQIDAVMEQEGGIA